MKEFKGTKGPWKATKNNAFMDVRNIGWINKPSALSTSVCLFKNGSTTSHHSEENIANAILIAAAPDLLNAAQYAVGCLHRLSEEMGQIGDNGDQALQALEGAIEKALNINQ